MAVDTKLLTQLRQLTGAGVVDCQAALQEANSDLDKAIEILRKKGAIKAAKKAATRTAGEGIIESYIHNNGKVGVLVKLLAETDFVARNQEFKELAHDLALQIAATNPSYLRPEDIPKKEIYRAQLKNEGKPKAAWDKIIAGKLAKYYQQVCLLQQPFIKDDKLTIEQLIAQKIAKIGEKIEVAEFTRYQI